MEYTGVDRLLVSVAQREREREEREMPAGRKFCEDKSRRTMHVRCREL